MRELLVAAADLLVGADCPGCGRPAITWCRSCAEELLPDPHVVDVDVPVPVITAGENAGILSRCLVAWKEQGRFGLLGPFGDLLATACCAHGLGERPVVLVPVPTAPRNVRARGSDVVAELAVAAAAALMTVGLDARAHGALRRVRATGDQVGLGRRARRDNVRGAFDVRRDRFPAGCDVLVVDDIVTTGASLAEAVRALDQADRRPIGAAVVAATPPPPARSR